MPRVSPTTSHAPCPTPQPLDSNIYFAFCMPAFILGAFYLVYSYYSGKRMGDNVNHDAHLFGSLFGIIFTALLRPMVLVEFFQQIAAFDLTNF